MWNICFEKYPREKNPKKNIFFKYFSCFFSILYNPRNSYRNGFTLPVRPVGSQYISFKYLSTFKVPTESTSLVRLSTKSSVVNKTSLQLSILWRYLDCMSKLSLFEPLQRLFGDICQRRGESTAWTCSGPFCRKSTDRLLGHNARHSPLGTLCLYNSGNYFVDGPFYENIL